jgi:N,N'-diacetyllegionaminate synthase
VSKNAQKADYQKQTTDASESQFDMIKKLELDGETHRELITYCQEKDIMFLSAPFDHESIDLLSDLGLQIFKIPSGEITNLPYLRHIGSLGKQVILSTGMSTLGEVGDALDVPALINTSNASPTSPRVDMPVDNITCLPNEPICLKYGKLVISPLGILNICNPKSLSRSILS